MKDFDGSDNGDLASLDHMKKDNFLNLEFTLNKIVNEEQKPHEIYSIRFCDNIRDFWSYFATVGGNHALIYEIKIKNQIQLIQGYVDEDKDELFYSCCWVSSLKGLPLLIVGGFRGILKVINCITFELEDSLLGHGNAINDLRTHPVDPNLVFSASKDESIRLWNVAKGQCVAIFGGDKGHRDEVLSIDVHPIGNCFLSTGMDTSIKIWNLNDAYVPSAISRSYDEDSNSDLGNEQHPFIQQMPLYSTTFIHNDYVDCARWMGDCILSKSTKSKAILWAPDATRSANAALTLKEFQYKDAHIWFLRFDLCIPLDLLAVGSTTGKVFIFSVSDTTAEPPSGKPLSAAKLAITLSHPKCSVTIRTVCFSPLGDWLLAGGSDGSLLLWSIASAGSGQRAGNSLL